MKNLFLFILLATALCNAQNKDVFDTARSGTVNEMKLLVQKNKDTINTISPAGYTPLILACYRGNTPVAEYLAANVKDINYKSPDGTALAAAAIKGNTAMAKVLLQNKANPNSADASGLTPLVYAVQFENKALIQLLLSYKADTALADKQGKTPYDYAAETNNPEIINLLKK